MSNEYQQSVFEPERWGLSTGSTQNLAQRSHFPYVTFSFNGTVTVFTSPDSSFREITNAIDNAQESIYVNLYQFHNFYLMDHLIDAINRSVNVKVLLEGDPVNRIGDNESYIAEQMITPNMQS
jgi:phosphatidylserine/phosphatidylglycerophosphate/cardiolipin synthase-like enzyme